MHSPLIRFPTKLYFHFDEAVYSVTHTLTHSPTCTQFITPWVTDPDFRCGEGAEDGSKVAPSSSSRTRDYCNFDLLPEDMCKDVLGPSANSVTTHLYANMKDVPNSKGDGGDASIVDVAGMDHLLSQNLPNDADVPGSS